MSSEPPSSEPSRPAPTRPEAASPGQSAPPQRDWLAAKERGGVFAIRSIVFITTFLGRTIGRLIARFVALYYTLTSPSAVAGLRSFYEHLEGRRARFGELYGHMLRFVHCTLDAFFFVSGKTAGFEVTHTGHEHLVALQDARRGAILLGAHVGSLYAMRVESRKARIPLYALMYTKNARMLNDALEKLDPEGSARILELDPEGGLDAMLKVKELIEQGALIAILGDRLPLHAGPEKVVRVPFLGAEASFPAGPFLLAATLKCPVYLTFGLSRGASRYELYCEPFAERIELPRGDRKAGLARHVARYAERLEHYARKAPDNWFNFYDFWRP